MVYNSTMLQRKKILKMYEFSWCNIILHRKQLDVCVSNQANWPKNKRMFSNSVTWFIFNFNPCPKDHGRNLFLPPQNHSDQCCHFQTGFSAQDGAGQKFKISSEPSGNKLSGHVFKNFACYLQPKWQQKWSSDIILLSGGGLLMVICISTACEDNNTLGTSKLQQFSLPPEGHIWVTLFNFFTHLR